MMERLFNHPTWLKVLSLIGAIVLWIYVMPPYFENTTRTFDVPLQVIMHPTYELVEGPKSGETIQVKVQGKALVVNRQRKESLRATVDYRDVEPGRPTEVPVEVEGPRDDQLVYTAVPKSVLVTLVEHKDGTFPLSVRPETGIVTVGNQDWLYTASPVSSQVVIRGRSDLLANVVEGIVTLESEDLTPSVGLVHKEVTPVDANGDRVALPGPMVDIAVDWERLPPGKQVKVKPVTTGQLPDGLSVHSVDVEPSRVTLRARSVDQSQPSQDSVATGPIDLSGKTQSFTVTVPLVPPEGTVVSVENVTVQVRIVETETERVLKGVPVRVRGQGDDTEVTLATSNVAVTVTGTYSAVAHLEPDSVEAYVDLEGLAPGEHTVPVKLVAPPGVSKVAADPESIDVKVIVP